MRPSSWLVVLAAIAAAHAAGAQTPAGAAKPNVVLIVTDDVGYGDFSSYGASDIRTPNARFRARRMPVIKVCRRAAVHCRSF